MKESLIKKVQPIDLSVYLLNNKGYETERSKKVNLTVKELIKLDEDAELYLQEYRKKWSTVWNKLIDLGGC
jgi:hypothetical protein